MNNKITKVTSPNVNHNSCFIDIAKTSQTALVISFFESQLHDTNPAIYSQEFLCSYGVAGAIKRNSIIVASACNTIVGACRYYRKKNGDVSLYQFAIREEYRGQRLLFRMLSMLGTVSVNSKCPIDIEFNDYYKKTGWIFEKVAGAYNNWVLEIKMD